MYNYFNQIKKDILNYIIKNKIDTNKPADALHLDLYGELWEEDSMTGYGEHGYFTRIEDARDAVCDNADILKKAFRDMDITSDIIKERLFDWIYWDSVIRCYLLYRALVEVIDVIKEINEW